LYLAFIKSALYTTLCTSHFSRFKRTTRNTSLPRYSLNKATVGFKLSHCQLAINWIQRFYFHLLSYVQSLRYKKDKTILCPTVYNQVDVKLNQQFIKTNVVTNKGNMPLYPAISAKI
jgi:hypothetical protein